MTKPTVRAASLAAILVLAAGRGFATDYFVHAGVGDDSNPGTSTGKPWKSLAKASTARLQPGDRILLAAGQAFAGSLVLKRVAGTAAEPVVVTSYPQGDAAGKATINARGHKSAIHILNGSNVRVGSLELTADGPGPDGNSGRGMRAGVLVELTRAGEYENIRLDDLYVHEVFFEPPGVTRSAEETQSANGTQSYGFGIRVLAEPEKVTLDGLSITNSRVENVSHTGIKIGGNAKQGVRNVRIENTRVKDTGGPGMQMSRVRDMEVRNNVINGSGSTRDTRNWGRGSGMWTWKSTDVLIEKNTFLNANGPADSAGVHIDFGCRNVIIQYNLSANNAGGFYEVLGDNHNTAYRYNISINDGYRVKGENGAFQDGKIFWLSGYVGHKKKESGPFNSYFYNNTIIVDEGRIARVALARSAEGVLIANNIFYIRGTSKALSGKQYKQAPGDYDAGRTVFRNNLFLRPDNWPAGTGISDSAPIIGDPAFALSDAMKIRDFRPTDTEVVADRGVPVEPIPGDPIGLPGGMAVTRDILGNSIDGLPDLGAIEISGSGDDDAGR